MGEVHDFDVAYVERDLGEVVGKFTQKASADGRGFEVQGTCPSCRGRMARQYSHGAPGTGTKGVLGRILGRHSEQEEYDVLASEVLYCECGYGHPGQPANPVFHGCGASWRVAQA